LELWRALVEGRWSVVDSYESDGRRLVVARRNEPRVRDPRGLSARESQVAAYASHGHSNKMIAYLLGVSESSVAAHLKSALSKLGVTSRVELTRLFHSAPS
jgi:DNA-binding NarL/FixJ family response regulator